MVQANFAALPRWAAAASGGRRQRRRPLDPLHSRESYAEDVRAYLALLGAVARGRSYCG